MGAAVMMMASMSVMGASANEYGSYQYGSNPKVSGSIHAFSGTRKSVTASTTNGGNITVVANVEITYKNTSGIVKTCGNGNSNKGDTSVTVTMPTNGTYQYATNTHLRGTFTLGTYRLYL